MTMADKTCNQCGKPDGECLLTNAADQTQMGSGARDAQTILAASANAIALMMLHDRQSQTHVRGPAVLDDRVSGTHALPGWVKYRAYTCDDGVVRVPSRLGRPSSYGWWLNESNIPKWVAGGVWSGEEVVLLEEPHPDLYDFVVAGDIPLEPFRDGVEWWRPDVTQKPVVPTTEQPGLTWLSGHDGNGRWGKMMSMGPCHVNCEHPTLGKRRPVLVRCEPPGGSMTTTHTVYKAQPFPGNAWLYVRNLNDLADYLEPDTEGLRVIAVRMTEAEVVALPEFEGW